MYEHRKTPSSASGLSHDNPKTLKIRVPAGEPDGVFARLVLETPDFLARVAVSCSWLMGAHDQIGRLLGRPSGRQVGALRLAAAHVLDTWGPDGVTADVEKAMEDLNATLDDMP